MFYKELLTSLIISNEKFIDLFNRYLFEKKMTISEFCIYSEISKSTIYKILSNSKKDCRISTIRQIINSVRKIEIGQMDETSIAIITTRESLNVISRKINIENENIFIKEYPATTIEEEIIQGVTAERNGVMGIICGPIAANTIEKIVNIPVIAIRFEISSLMDAVQNIIKKI